MKDDDMNGIKITTSGTGKLRVRGTLGVTIVNPNKMKDEEIKKAFKLYKDKSCCGCEEDFTAGYKSRAKEISELNKRLKRRAKTFFEMRSTIKALKEKLNIAEEALSNLSDDSDPEFYWQYPQIAKEALSKIKD